MRPVVRFRSRAQFHRPKALTFRHGFLTLLFVEFVLMFSCQPPDPRVSSKHAGHTANPRVAARPARFVSLLRGFHRHRRCRCSLSIVYRPSVSPSIMRKGISFRKLGRDSAHRYAMMRNMAASLIEHERIVTTTAKAKVRSVRFAAWADDD
jgi:hypothetical protein